MIDEQPLHHFRLIRMGFTPDKARKLIVRNVTVSINPEVAYAVFERRVRKKQELRKSAQETSSP